MRVVVPYANAARDPVALEATLRNLARQSVAATAHDVSGDVQAYSRLFHWLWETEPDGFILVEHDVLPWVGFYPTLRDCPSPWCGLNTSLQATKFVPRELGPCPVQEPCHWQDLDELFYVLWDERGLSFCEHPPEPANITFPYPEPSQEA